MTILDRILQHKKSEVEAAKLRISLETVRQEAEIRAGDFAHRFQKALHSGNPVSLIAEVKKASPSKGLIRPNFDPAALALEYTRGGAHAISVLTDTHFFQGGLDHFDAVRAAVDLPLLRKEFIIDPYQLYEARAHGADAALLIVAALSPNQLGDYIALCRSLGMNALVEIHTEDELDVALNAGADVIGINNRDLKTFHTTLDVSRRLVPLIPEGVTIVSESGIQTAADLAQLHAMGVHAVLVGEALAKQEDVEAATRRLLGQEEQP